MFIKKNHLSFVQASVEKQNNSLNESRKSGGQNVPFRRVPTEKVYVDPKLADNSFEGKVNALAMA